MLISTLQNGCHATHANMEKLIFKQLSDVILKKAAIQIDSVNF